MFKLVEQKGSLIYTKDMKIPLRWLLPVLLLLRFPAFAQTPGGIDSDTQRALQNYHTGRDLESRNRMNEAEPFYNEAARLCNAEISRSAASRDTYAVLTWTLQRQRKYADVIAYGEQALRLYADEYRIVETMGEAYFYLDDYDRSLRLMQRYTNLAPRGERVSVAYFFIGEIYRYREQFRHADIAYTTAVRLEPGLALWWYRLGSVREAVGDFSQATEAYEQAIRLNPNYREANDGLVRSRR
jgi:tetratricopeptide (TPR) repeat protein